MQREGDWGAQAHDSIGRPFPEFELGDRPALDEGAWEPENVGACQVTGTPLDQVLGQMYALGLTADDVGHLERLSDRDVRRRLGNSKENFPHHERENVIAYLLTWADLLEEQLGSPVEAIEDFLEAAE